MKRKEALKKLEAKTNYKKAKVSRMEEIRTTLEAKRNEHQRMLSLSMTSNTTLFTGAVTSPPTFLHGHKPPLSARVNDGFSGLFKKWF